MKRSLPFLVLGVGLATTLFSSGTTTRLVAAEMAPQSTVKPTADQAQNNPSDIETMRAIRKSIVADKTLSTSAHNVKIIAEQGRVTLRGTVPTEAEKSNIEAKACAVAGTENVVNNIRVKRS